jgi:two-component system, NarL family, sensor histidine kinase EvgS
MKNILKILFLVVIIFYNNLFAINNTKETHLEKTILQLEWKHQFEFAGFYAALEKGYYEDIGIDLEIKEFEDGVNITEDVINGKSTYGISSSALILERLKNKPVVLIASYFKQNALALITKPYIKTPYDLKNKKIMALNWEMDHTSLGVMLKDYGIKKDDYTLVNHDFKIDSFINGQVDAMSIFITSQPFELDQLGIKYNILNPANFGIYSYDVELFTSEKVISNDLEKVNKFVEATNRGWEYAFANKNEIVNLIYNKYSKRKTKEALLYEAEKSEEIFKTNVFKIGAITPELVKLNADMYSNLGLVDKNYNLNTIINNYLITNKKLLHLNFTDEEKNFLKENPKIKVHNESNWPPFNYSLNNSPLGFSIDYMNLLASKIGLSIEYVSGFTWDEFLEKIKKNEIDVMLNIAKTEDREKYLAFTSSYAKNIDTVFVKKDINNLKNLNDFKGKTLAIIKGFYEEDLLRKYYPEIKFILVNDTLEALKKVAFNEVDGAFDSLAVGNYFMENNYISNLKPAFEVQDPRFNLDIHIAVNKSNLILRNILEKAKNEITQDEISTLNKKWINTNEIKAQDDNNNISLTKKEELYLSNKSIITMCIDPNWEPFEKIDKHGKHVGISADIIKLITDRLNIQIKLIPTKNWEESLAFSKNKKCDILSFLNETPKRKEWLNFTNTLFTDENVIIGRNETPIIKNLSKIKASIAIPKETAMYERIQKDFPNLVIIPVNSEEEAFKYVEERKADLTIRSLIVSAFAIKENGYFNLDILNQPNGYENYLKIGVQKDDLILVDILNKAIQTITEDDIKNIVNKWVAIKYEKGIDYTYLWISFSIIFILLIFFLYRQYLLKHTNDYLKSEVEKRTAQVEESNLILKQKRNELHELNQNLEIKIKEEIEKNKMIQEKLFKADKMASMGEMISNIAHQWRQPLSVISTIATGVKLQKEIDVLNNDELIGNMDLINKNAQYLSKTIDDFRNFIKGDRNIQNYKLTDTIANFINIVESSIKNHNIKLILNLNDEIRIEGNPNELIQCLINLFNNSRDALVETKQNELLIFINTQIEENTIQIKIKDNAGGIPENIMPKIYEPYFTTKHQSQGTGLGLHMTYRLITEAMNGRIETTNMELEYNNKSYKGVEFKIILDI